MVSDNKIGLHRMMRKPKFGRSYYSFIRPPHQFIAKDPSIENTIISFILCNVVNKNKNKIK